jgi:iron complex transport system substrate-binding protein
VLRRPLIALAALVAALTLAVLAAARPTQSHAYPITVHAANGDVVISSRPSRIVSLSPTGTEDLFAVGAGSQVIAVDNDSDYPKQAPRTSLSGYTPNAEAVAAYNPDLVVVSNDGGIIAQLHKLGLKVLLEPAAANLAQAYDEIRQLGDATGHTAAATTLVGSMERQLTQLIRSVPRKSRHLKVYHELEQDYYSVTSATFIGSIYKLFGFRNIADGADPTHSGYPQLSGEYILAQNPDIIVLADTVCCGQSAKTLAARPGWGNLSAVKHHRVIAVNDDIASRWGPRIVDFARIVATAARQS